MTKLEKLYASIRNLQELGLPINKETQEAVDRLEEDLIKNEILPSLSENIEPMLSQIQRDLVLVVEYHPGEPLSVRLSRKMNIAKALEAKQITTQENNLKEPTLPKQNATPQHHEIKAQNITRAPKTGLCVYLPSGDFIQESKASETMALAVRKAGAERVAALKIYHDKQNLVSKDSNPPYPISPHSVGNGYYVNTHSSTAVKKLQLDTISKALRLGWKVKIVK